MMWDEVKHLIKTNHRFVITTHINPDEDGIGAACAFIEMLRHAEKEVQFICDSPIPEKFRFLDFYGLYHSYHADLPIEPPDVLIILDTHRKDRIGRLSLLAQQEGVTGLCVDHHIPTQVFTPVTVMNPEACSVGAMIYDFFEESDFPLNKRAAMGIYASIAFDTGRFSYASTTQRTHRIADHCISLGVNPDEMFKALYQQISVAQSKIFAYMFLHSEVVLNGEVIVLGITLKEYQNFIPECQELENVDFEYVHEFNKSIKEVGCTVLLREVRGDCVRVSLRSRGKIDVGQVCSQFGGGGHHRTAGAILKGDLASVKEEVIKGLGIVESVTI